VSNEHVLQFKSSRCMDSESQSISRCLVYEPFHVEVVVENLFRKQTITNIIRIALYRDVSYGLDEKIKEIDRWVTVPPLGTERLVVSFMPTHESDYYYTIHINDKMVKTKMYPCRLSVSRKGNNLDLDEPPSAVSAGSTIVFTGKLVNATTGEGIDKARIHIHHIDRSGNKFMASGTTKEDGAFNIEWIAKKLDALHYSGEIYAKFEGDDIYKPSRSNQFTISVVHEPIK